MKFKQMKLGRLETFKNNIENREEEIYNRQ